MNSCPRRVIARESVATVPRNRLAAAFLLGAALALGVVAADAANPPVLQLPVKGDAHGVPPHAIPVTTLAEAVKTGRVPREIAEAAAREGHAWVIIKLALPTGWRPEHELSSAQVEQQQQAIRQTQQRILDQLVIGTVDDVKRYRFVPHMAMQVDELALTELVKMREVFVIRADHADEPTLTSSTRRIGADNVVSALNGDAGFWKYVAILDTGVDKNHPFFNGRVVSEGCYSTDGWGKDGFCPNGKEATTVLDSGLPCNVNGCDHGTHVAGIAAGGASGFTFSGVAPGARIIAMQVFHGVNSKDDCAPRPAPCAKSQTSDQVLALERVYELRNYFSIAAVNLSLGSRRGYTDQNACNEDNESRFDAFTLLRGANIAPVVASGNFAQVMLPGGGTAFSPGISAPACVTPAVSVGRVNDRDVIDGSSQVATYLSLLAPGTSINSSIVGGGFANMSGTSMSAPHVAGAFAVLKHLNPNQTVDQMLNRLRATGVLVTDTRMNPPLQVPRIRLDVAVESQTGLPLSPSEVVITNVTGTRVWARWRDNSRSETSFRLTAKPADPLLPTKHGTALQNEESGSVSSLLPNKSYKLDVQACNAANQCSAPATVSFTTVNTLPCVPTNFHAGTVTTTSIQVLWSSNCPDATTSFRLRSNVSGNWNALTLGGNLRGKTFTNLTPNKAYSFVIQACNADGCSGDSPILTVQTQSAGSPPASPSNLHVCGSVFMELCWGSGVRLLWNDNSNNEDQFELQWTPAQSGGPPFSNSNYSTVIVGANTTAHAFSSFPSGTITYFRVRACNAAGCSAFSNQASYTAP